MSDDPRADEVPAPGSTPDPAPAPAPDPGEVDVVEVASVTPESGAFSPAERAAARRKAIIRGALIGGYLFVVFGILLPQIVDYREVIAAFQAVPPEWLAVVVLVGVVLWMVEGAAINAMLPELGLIRGTVTFLSMSAVGSTVPGPVKLAFAYRLFRGWEIPPDRAILGLSLQGLMQQASKLVLPAIAVFLLTVLGTLPSWGFLVAVLISLPVALGALVSIWILRSEEFARRVGRATTRASDAVARRIRRPEPEDLTPRLLGFREKARGMLLARLVPSATFNLLARAMGYVLLLISLRAVGVGPEVLPADIVLAVYAAVMTITLLPIAPGGAGLPELLYITFFTNYAADPAVDDAIAAGVMLFRGMSWFVPIPVGYLALYLERRREKRRAARPPAAAVTGT
ncbi:MAG TPA: lysylphosphatidylglycerol synthase domain-containing protein [Candidatus Limnocylindrales bacterium]|nr:lysylphosphatidylglycerol synthase domain-containing protein [Candidatus Limnocylindrales bacterium]